jgi:hypothetical protein
MNFSLIIVLSQIAGFYFETLQKVNDVWGCIVPLLHDAFPGRFIFAKKLNNDECLIYYTYLHYIYDTILVFLNPALLKIFTTGPLSTTIWLCKRKTVQDC